MGGGECCMGSSVSAAGRVSCGLRAQCCMDLHGSWSIWMVWEEVYRETLWNPSRGCMFSGCLQEQNGQLVTTGMAKKLRSKSFDFLPLSRSTGRKAPELGGLLAISLRKLSLVRVMDIPLSIPFDWLGVDCTHLLFASRVRCVTKNWTRRAFLPQQCPHKKGRCDVPTQIANLHNGQQPHGHVPDKRDKGPLRDTYEHQFSDSQNYAINRSDRPFQIDSVGQLFESLRPEQVGPKRELFVHQGAANELWNVVVPDLFLVQQVQPKLEVMPVMQCNPAPAC